ncbi:Nif3-like dinuclear metal center hexameric protein [Lysinibacter sp. HNR]|uniref:Nif3-like dinuclear metal center hexameric protein n=1 Tax=Lysinibacter sp. HNR TaxID=3031408 RepID=UPI0024348B20|nr:Nif3-like dinuclear metal center hexameric protein [Lysinibacter sp. HNR]WGD38562.1 Nif3-like dinuclear metal center hexameric protein [Lysinibacter sp. HNR]
MSTHTTSSPVAPSLKQVRLALNTLWPEDSAEEWDRVGLVSGDPSSKIEKILLAVDAVRETVDEAVDTGVDLLLTHHPLLLRGVTSVAEDRYKGSLLADLIRAGCALMTAHTNADIPREGVSDRIAQLIGLIETRALVPSSHPRAEEGTGIGRVGNLEHPTTLGQFAQHVAQVLPPTASGVRVSGDYNRPINRVALCGGAGDGLLSHSEVLASDVYLTSDLRHHPASEFREQALCSGGPALIDVSHWAGEWLWLDGAAERIRELLPSVEVVVSELRTDVWDFSITQ